VISHEHRWVDAHGNTFSLFEESVAKPDIRIIAQQSHNTFSMAQVKT
jgi:hypothetical protein